METSLLKRKRSESASEYKVNSSAPIPDFCIGKSRLEASDEEQNSTEVVGHHLQISGQAADDVSLLCGKSPLFVSEGEDREEPSEDDSMADEPSPSESSSWSPESESSSWDGDGSAKRRPKGPGRARTRTSALQLRGGKSIQSLIRDAEGFGQRRRRGPARFPDVPWARSMCDHLRKSLLDARARCNGERTLQLGTDCSGAEAPWFALQLIIKELAHQLGWQLRVDHMFACDIEPTSQAFIARNTKPRSLFGNLLDRGQMGHCLIAEREVRVPGNLDLYVAGFPCKDFSILNSNRPCLEGPHANTFHGVVNYIRQNEPATFVLENVLGLTLRKNGEDAPIATVMGILQGLGQYDVHFWRVNSLDYHLPQNRARVYIVGVHTSRAKLHRPLEEWSTSVRAMESHLGHILHDFMLADAESEVLSELQRQEARIQQGRREAAGSRWNAANRQLRQKMGLRRNENPMVPVGSGWSRFLSARTQDVLEIQALRISKRRTSRAGKPEAPAASQHATKRARPCSEELLDAADPVNSMFCAEISRSAAYGSNRWRSTPCLTPGSRIWVFNRKRWLLGLEMMALQGFPVDDINLDGLEDRHLALLSGNAMSVPVIGLFLFLILANVSFPERQLPPLLS